MLGEVDLAHAALAELAHQPVLAVFPGLVQLDAEAVEQDRAADRHRGGHEEEQGVRAGVLRGAELHGEMGDLRVLGQRGDAEQGGHRHRQHGPGHGPGVIRDERAVEQHQDDHLDHAVLHERDHPDRIIGADQREVHHVLREHDDDRQAAEEGDLERPDPERATGGSG